MPKLMSLYNIKSTVTITKKGELASS